MTTRAYTVSEIDALRGAAELRYLWGSTAYTEASASRSYRESDMIAAVEEMVRTYMLAGITASDIFKEDQARAERWREAMKPQPREQTVSDEELERRRKQLAEDLGSIAP